MHILVTNDDGPPSTHSSPYISAFVTALHAAGHTTTVVIPNTQKSWIGKAHIAHTTVTTRSKSFKTDIFDPTSSAPDHPNEWILVDGTPATCTQLGLGYYKPGEGWGEGFDLVVSGPNYGRNSTSVFALSSGTLGGAMEAVTCKKRAIALSFAFNTREHSPPDIAAASRASVHVIETLVASWPAEVEIFSLNVPLGSEHLRDGATPIVEFTRLLSNTWHSGPCFQEIEGSFFDEEEEEGADRREEEIRGEEERAQRGEDGGERGGEVQGGERKRVRRFRWAPVFKDIADSVERAGEGYDGWALTKGRISITPLRASFEQVPLGGGEWQFFGQAVRS